MSTEIEKLKINSNALRGTIKQSLNNPITSRLATGDDQLIKFHGIYQQDNRDRREAREKIRLEPDHSFMLRIRIPAGIVTSKQLIAINDISDSYGEKHYKCTTRQTIQIHHIAKQNLPSVISHLHLAGLDSKATCGDVNRNITTASHTLKPALLQECLVMAQELSDAFLPTSQAYEDLFLGNNTTTMVPDAMYQDRYLPRKFKTAIAIPPINDCDLFTNDLGFIVNGEKEIESITLVLGGGLGHTFGNVKTFPKLGTPIGNFPKKHLPAVMKAVLEFQRDFGNRNDRKLSRLKHTIAELGLEFTKKELEKISSITFDPPIFQAFTTGQECFGWNIDENGKSRYTLKLPSGRVSDQLFPYKSFIRQVASELQVDWKITSFQNLHITAPDDKNKDLLKALIKHFRLDTQHKSEFSKELFGCTSFPQCPLAFAEAERIIPNLEHTIEALLLKHNLLDLQISMRVSGCPNSCARPELAEIGLIGKSKSRYNLYLGADRAGTRMNFLFQESVTLEDIYKQLDSLFHQYSVNKNHQEYFGDFCHRTIQCNN
ncbi:MAG: NADPH-dependent assimilatory sulfite reductase hemoprotein subunit [Methylacidiphilales bacterium]|nr:NADPH-dependent assimilatory sulfite reductase hemoprotein subunit [Candidatus Methylacidiphilales bacterium]